MVYLDRENLIWGFGRCTAVDDLRCSMVSTLVTRLMVAANTLALAAMCMMTGHVHIAFQ